jgi:hypothetical protein
MRRFAKVLSANLDSRGSAGGQSQTRRASMKIVIPVLIFASALVMAQDKPRVFVQGKGSQDVATTGAATGGRHWASGRSDSTIDSHDEAMQVNKDLQKDCTGVILTLNQSNADYTIMLNRESKHNRGLLRTNSQVQVANRLGDVLGTNATRTVGNASKDACEIILADWSQHGRLPDPPAAAPAAAASQPPAVAAAAVVPAVGTSAAVAAAVPASATTPSPTLVSAVATPASPAAASSAPAASAQLSVASDPAGADIEIDGNFVGSTPSNVGVASGQHQISIKKSGFKTWERKMTISSGQVSLNASLEAEAN